MRDDSKEPAYKHVMRTWLFGTLMVNSNVTPAGLVDPEIQAVSLLLHDLGFDRSGRRWEERRVQLVWDAIALHTKQKYALFEEPDVAAVSTGIFMDFAGPGSRVSPAQYSAVVDEFPNGDLRDRVRDVFTWLCSTKAIATYGEFCHRSHLLVVPRLSVLTRHAD